MSKLEALNNKLNNLMNTEDNVKRFKLVTFEMENIYTRKNHDYGNSFDKSLDADGLLVSKIRLGDKLSRFVKLISTQAQVQDESIRDTLVDLANYAVMTVMWLDAKKEEEAFMVMKLLGELGMKSTDFTAEINIEAAESAGNLSPEIIEEFKRRTTGMGSGEIDATPMNPDKSQQLAAWSRKDGLSTTVTFSADTDGDYISYENNGLVSPGGLVVGYDFKKDEKLEEPSVQVEEYQGSTEEASEPKCKK